MSKHTDFSRIFIDRPILATVLSTLILVSGLIAIPNLSISEYPDVVPPSVQVTANYPGANPRTIADTVAGPIEEAVNGVENMIYMKSTSSADGQMALTVTFVGLKMVCPPLSRGPYASSRCLISAPNSPSLPAS